MHVTLLSIKKQTSSKQQFVLNKLNGIKMLRTEKNKFYLGYVSSMWLSFSDRRDVSTHYSYKNVKLEQESSFSRRKKKQPLNQKTSV